jgi:hypothetical protein
MGRTTPRCSNYNLEYFLRLLCQDDLNPGDSTEVYHDEALRIAANIAKLPEL